jgi:predicted amidophosphoribosyltransferase
MATAIANPSTELLRDLKTLALFIHLYCHYKHADSERKGVDLRTHDVAAIAGKTIVLCPECTKLLAHAFVKRTHCPMDPKPMCKHCPNHCYHPTYRQQIREVMKFSGRKMVLGGRLDYLFHLLF